MKILIISPSIFPTISGNSRDVDRIQKGLQQKGHEVMIMTSEKVRKEDVEFFEPDVIHAFHAYKSRIVMEFNTPYILTLTGTDYNHDLNDEVKGPIVKEVIKKAEFVTFLNKLAFDSMKDRLGIDENQACVIMRGIPDLPDCKKSLFVVDGFNFILIAGIREVKNNLFAIKAIKGLHAICPDVNLYLFGPTLNQEYREALKKEIGDADYIHLKGTLPPEEISCVYKIANVVLNCSKSEGDSNVLTEAMYLGKPILASNIEGNRVRVDDGKNGILYEPDDVKDFISKAKKIIEDNEFREMLIYNSKKKMELLLNKDEISEFEEIYEKVIKN